MRKFAYAILIITVMVAGLLFLGDAQAATYISGTINANTTWTSANSPYTLTGDVIISSGVTVTVQPGVTVNFGSYKLYVTGILNAQGTSEDNIVFSGNGYSSIVFTAASIDWSGISGCIVDNAYISALSLVVEDSSPRISNNYLISTYGTLVAVSGGSPSILNNVFVFDTGNCIHINSGSSPVITYNVIAGNGQNCYGIYTEGTAYISNNNITECWTGVYAVGASTIQYNNIMENDNDGVHSENNASIIQNNVLANNNVGVTGTGIIRDNTIANNQEAGIWGPLLSASIYQNNIYDNTVNAHLTQPDNITAVNNWWGTTIAEAINQTIWDHKNDPINLGTLNFDPYLGEPNPLAPSIPPFITIPSSPIDPTPTPTPTPSPSPTPSDAPTPSPSPTPTSPTASPSPTIAPTETPQETPDQSDTTDMNSIVVIVVAILIALVIIVFINRKYGKSQAPIDDRIK